MRYNPDDTIVAISTPVGDGGIGIVRMSGPEALAVADKVFRPKSGKAPTELETHTVHYGHIVDRGAAVDEVILTIMRAPRSYTREDIVEINCHGGIAALKKVLGLVLASGARMAEPGEFTKRAFMNGRIDLAQAESVLDVIKAKTETGLRAAIGQLGGGLSGAVRKTRSALVDIVSRLEAAIDFPEEEDVVAPGRHESEEALKGIIDELDRLVQSSEKGIIARDGIKAVLCGRPNVGKSSLMNALLGQDRAIVSHIPGTTRDSIEETASLGGVPCRMVDTAGIVEEGDILTLEGVRRTHLLMSGADLILFVVDGSMLLTDGDISIARAIGAGRVVIVINKTDLPRRLELASLEKILPDRPVVAVSAATGDNIDGLESAVSEMVWAGGISTDHTVLVTNVRHKSLLCGARDMVEEALDHLRDGISPEILSFELGKAADSLGEITGEQIDAEILDRIFDKFCIGK